MLKKLVKFLPILFISSLAYGAGPSVTYGPSIPDIRNLSVTINGTGLTLDNNLRVSGNSIFTGYMQSYGSIYLPSGTLNIATANAPANTLVNLKTASGVIAVNLTNSTSKRIGALYNTGEAGGLALYGSTGSNTLSLTASAASFFNGGNVGFGTSTPQRKFSLIGDAQVTGNAYLNGNLIFNVGALVDTNLYRSAADNLKTDDNLTVALGLNVGTATGASTGRIFCNVTNDTSFNLIRANNDGTGGVLINAQAKNGGDAWFSSSMYDTSWKTWSFGLDDSDSDSFKICFNTTGLLDSGDMFKILTTGETTIINGVNVGSATGATTGQIKASGSLIVSGNIVSNGASWGGYYVSGNVTATNIIDTWTAVTVNAVSQTLFQATHAAGVVTCVNAGTYWVHWSGYISAKTPADDLHFGVLVNGALNPVAGSITEFTDANSSSQYIGGQCFATLTAGQNLSLAVRNFTSASRDCTIEYMNFTVRKMW